MVCVGDENEARGASRDGQSGSRDLERGVLAVAHYQRVQPPERSVPAGARYQNPAERGAPAGRTTSVPTQSFCRRGRHTRLRNGPLARPEGIQWSMRSQRCPRSPAAKSLHARALTLRTCALNLPGRYATAVPLAPTPPTAPTIPAEAKVSPVARVVGRPWVAGSRIEVLASPLPPHQPPPPPLPPLLPHRWV